MILPSKEVTLITANQNKEIFLFDPKTTSIAHKYRDDTCIIPSIAYYPLSQQIIAPQIGKTFISVWSSDSQEAELKISLSENLTTLHTSEDGHFLYGGSATGNLYIWELPCGILLKKKSIHSSQIRSIVQCKNNHLITVSKTEVKQWSLSSFFIETQNTSPIKTYTSILQIISAFESRNILAVLTHKHLSFLQCSLQVHQKEFAVIHKIDYEYVCSMCTSKTAAFVGDTKGVIQIIQLFVSEQEKAELTFKLREGSRQLQISRPRKKRALLSPNKQPVTAISYVQSLAYLISGYSSGQITIWSNYEIKKSLHLFKTSITCIKVISKPRQVKIRQTGKIKPLNKYQMSRQNQVLDILPRSFANLQEDELQHGFQKEDQGEKILFKMLETIQKSANSVEEELATLRRQKQQLIETNLMYFKMLLP